MTASGLYIGIIFFLIGCSNVIDLGLADGSVSNSQFTASSEYDSTKVASNVRMGVIGASWRPSDDDYKPWLQVDFQETVTVAMIKTRGAYDVYWFVRTFSVSYGDDGSNFQDHVDGERTKVCIFECAIRITRTQYSYFFFTVKEGYCSNIYVSNLSGKK